MRRAALAVAAGAASLLWPAILNSYPLVFSDTGAFLAQTLMPLPIWDKPYVYGPWLHALHLRVSLWAPAVAQGLLISWLLWLTQRVLRDCASALRHIALCAGLALGTAAPWFTALLMPDVLAPALVLALFLLGFGADRLSGAERAGVTAAAAFAAAAHLSHLPLAASLALLALILTRSLASALRCVAPLVIALLMLLGTNCAVHGRAAVSPYGAVFMLARLVADGPAARTIEERCPEVPWLLCDWRGRLPRDSDAFLWAGDGPVWADRRDGSRGPVALAPEARAIVRETLLREPGAVLRDASRNALRQLALTGVDDILAAHHLAVQVGGQLAVGFPVAEQRRFAASLQAQGLLPGAARPWLFAHTTTLAVSAALSVGLCGLLLWGRGDLRVAGLLLGVLLGLLVNAAVTGSLSAPHGRYQARVAWLLPAAILLALPVVLARRDAAAGRRASPSAAMTAETPR